MNVPVRRIENFIRTGEGKHDSIRTVLGIGPRQTVIGAGGAVIFKLDLLMYIE